MAAQHLPRYLGGLAVDKRRTRSNERRRPNHFDNYFAEIASVHKYQTKLVSPQTYYIPRMKTSLGQLFLQYIGPKIWYNIPEKLKSSSPYSFGKKYKKSPVILPDFLLIFVLYASYILFDLRFVCLSHSVKSR